GTYAACKENPIKLEAWLNEIVKIAPPPDAADPTSSVITVLFDTWYPGNVTPQKDLVVPQWNTTAQRAAMYTGAVARACRTCHVANAAPTLPTATGRLATA
ncbi:MAG: hypothetical protein AAB289_03430, partial [Chloroflexota bacterium]